MKSCDYSGEAVAEEWVGEQEVAAAVAAAAGQDKGEGPGQTGVRWPGCTLLGHLAPYLRQRGDPPKVVKVQTTNITTPEGPSFRILLFPCPLLSLPSTHAPHLSKDRCKGRDVLQFLC